MARATDSEWTAVPTMRVPRLCRGASGAAAEESRNAPRPRQHRRAWCRRGAFAERPVPVVFMNPKILSSDPDRPQKQRPRTDEEPKPLGRAYLEGRLNEFARRARQNQADRTKLRGMYVR